MSSYTSKSIKGTIKAKLIGPVVNTLVPVVYAAPNPVGKQHSCVVDGVPTLKCLEVIFENVLGLASGLVVVVLFIMFVVGSFTYLTSAGNPEKMAKARSTMLWAVIGTVLFLGSSLILQIIKFLFLGDDFSLFELGLPDP